MRKLLSSSEVVDTVEIEGRSWEVFATGDAEYDELAARLVMRLDVILRPMEGRAEKFPPRPKWFPDRTLQLEHVPFEEATDVAKEIFGSWVKRIQRSIPNNENPSPVSRL